MAKQLPKTLAEKAYEQALKENPGLEKVLRALPQFPDVEECNNAAIDLLVAKEMDGYTIQASLSDPIARRKQFSPGHIATMARWAHSKHVYRFDPDLRETLMSQEAPSVIPAEALLHLPYPIIHIEAPVDTATVKMKLEGETDKEVVEASADIRRAKGFFAYVTRFSEEIAGSEFYALNIMYVFEDLSLTLTQLNLSLGTLGDAIQEHLGFIERDVAKIPEATAAEIKEKLICCFTQVVNLLLYVVAENAETEVAYKPTGLTAKPKVSQAEVIEVGTRIGADLRAARTAYVDDRSESGHAGRAPHIRRGHYHSYWTGPKTADQILKVKWLSPIAVNVGKGESSVVTVHGVKE